MGVSVVFTATDIETRIRQRPFRALRIVTRSGETYDVLHPDLVMVGLRDIAVGLTDEAGSPYYDHLARVAFMHIAALQDLPTSSAPSENDQS
jgi:glutamine synthetase type III